jgi:hypothetical protein
MGWTPIVDADHRQVLRLLEDGFRVAEAERVGCGVCHVEPGQPCRTRGKAALTTFVTLNGPVVVHTRRRETGRFVQNLIDDNRQRRDEAARTARSRST